MKRLVMALVLAGLSAATIGLAAATAAHALPPGCSHRLPVVAHHAEERGVALRHLPAACGFSIGYATSETTIAAAGDGALIFSPAETENTMARSTDAGAQWNLTYPEFEQPTSFWNTVDPFVVGDPRTGWVFWSHATGPVRNQSQLPPITPLPQGSGFYLAGAMGFQVYSSPDNGRTWRTADYSTAPTGDWEKVFVGPPPPAGSGAPRPKGYPDVVYLCANSPVEIAGPGRLCYRSLDGGLKFSPAGYVSPSPQEPPDMCPPLNFNTGVVDPKGTTYQPVDCGHSAYVVASGNEGSTYKWLPLPSAPTGTTTSGTNLKLAVDYAGNLYAEWNAGGLLYLDVSTDHARTWRPPMMVAAPGLHNIQLPAIAAGAAGHVGLVYYASMTPHASKFTAYITQTANATARQPLFYSGAINNPARPIFHNYGLYDYPRTDFIGGGYDRQGTTFWAAVVKQFGPPNKREYIQTIGWVGRLVFPSAAHRHKPGVHRHKPTPHHRKHASRPSRTPGHHRGFTG
jgi:hypothetical protein